jgi:hypothetical protein
MSTTEHKTQGIINRADNGTSPGQRDAQRKICRFRPERTDGRDTGPAQHIREMLRPEMELSAVARACVLNSGDKRVIKLLQ